MVSFTEIPLKIRLEAEREARSYFGYDMDDHIQPKDRVAVTEEMKTRARDAMEGKGVYTASCFPAF